MGRKKWDSGVENFYSVSKSQRERVRDVLAANRMDGRPEPVPSVDGNGSGSNSVSYLEAEQGFISVFQEQIWAEDRARRARDEEMRAALFSSSSVLDFGYICSVCGQDVRVVRLCNPLVPVNQVKRFDFDPSTVVDANPNRQELT